LSGKWVSTDTIDMEPSIRNFQGQASVNRDLTSISWLAATPFSGGYHSGTMRVNGKTPICKELTMSLLLGMTLPQVNNAKNFNYFRSSW